MVQTPLAEDCSLCDYREPHIIKEDAARRCKTISRVRRGSILAILEDNEFFYAFPKVIEHLLTQDILIVPWGGWIHHHFGRRH